MMNKVFGIEVMAGADPAAAAKMQLAPTTSAAAGHAAAASIDTTCDDEMHCESDASDNEGPARAGLRARRAKASGAKAKRQR